MLASASFAVALAIATSGWAYQENESQPTLEAPGNALPENEAAQPAAEGDNGGAAAEGVGLNGILPLEIPSNLSEDALSELGGNWSDWAAETSAEVQKLYDGLPTVEEQRAQLEVLRRKAAVVQEALEDPRYRSLHLQLGDLHGALVRRVELAEAALDSLEVDFAQVREQRLDDAADEVTSALIAVHEDLTFVRNGLPWFEWVQYTPIREALQEETPADERLRVLSAALANLQAKDKLNPEQQEFVNRSSFQQLESALAGYVETAEQTEAPDEQQHRAKLADLFAAIEDYEESHSKEDSQRVRQALNELRAVSPDYGDLMAKAVTTHYVNYNLQVLVTEQFLDRYVHERRTETGPVRDFILGADVFGSQITDTEVGVDLKPSNDSGRFDITLSGVSRSRTAGYTPQATVYTNGFHRFHASKEVTFDGHNFRTKPARIAVNANNTTVGAETSVSWIPIIGWIADGIAESRAEDKRPESEAIARQRVASKVLPRFNREVRDRFNDEEQDLEGGFYQRLKDAGVYPRETSIRTSTSYLRISSQVMDEGELGGAPTNAGLEPGPGLTIHAHESLLNNAAARLNLAGRTMTDSEFRAELERFLSTIAGEPVDLKSAKEEPGDEDVPDTFIFAEKDPLRCRIGEGVVTIIIRAGFKKKNGETVPTKEVEVPLTFRVREDAIYIEPGNVRVGMVERVSGAQHVAEAVGIRKKMNAAFEGQKRDRKFMLEREGKRDLPVWVTKIRARNGWVTVWAQ